ncbi:MAG: asparagine synthase (glutamine-hydrolyzing) [Gammaproteobacteria bacterium]
MCGIVGFQGEFEPELLQRMTNAVAHRGPDGEGLAMLSVAGAAPVGLGHRRLAIIDLSTAGHQPMTVLPDAGGGMRTGLTLTYNGEIYNFRELRSELETQGHRFVTATDSEVLLHLYERDGLRMVDQLNGIFAFAIHDARADGRPEGVERGALFLARDRLGVKPLYYAETATGLLFASEIKALICCKELSRAIDPVALHQMLAYLWTPAPRTMLAGVRKLEPGAALVVAGGRVRRHWRYYTIPYEGVRDTRSAAMLAEELSERVSTAVRRQLVADVPVGAFLSGGLDSSAVVAMMRRALPDSPITCFSIGFQGDEAVEGNPADLPYARQVAQHLRVDLHEIHMQPEAIDRLEEMVSLLDEPQADPAPLNALMIAERSRAMGIPVLLSGAGGDDLLSGYRRHWALAFERNWSWLPQGVRAGVQSVAARSAGGGGWRQSGVLSRRLAKMFAYAGENADRRLVSYFWWSTDQVRRSLYTPQFAEQVGGADVAEPLLQSLQQIPDEHDPLQRMLYLDTRHFLADHNLNYTDRAGMAVGVEVRVPLLDLDLVRFATRIPAGVKQRGRVGKAVFKQAMERYLPRNVIYRPKSGFGAPLRRWLQNELRQRVEDTLGAEALRHRGYFDPAAVRRLIDLDRAGAIDGSYTIFALMCFEIWCRRFVDGGVR